MDHSSISELFENAIANHLAVIRKISEQRPLLE
jgi:hypothetical protein